MGSSTHYPLLSFTVMCKDNSVAWQRCSLLWLAAKSCISGKRNSLRLAAPHNKALRRTFSVPGHSTMVSPLRPHPFAQFCAPLLNDTTAFENTYTHRHIKEDGEEERQQVRHCLVLYMMDYSCLHVWSYSMSCGFFFLLDCEVSSPDSLTSQLPINLLK